MSSWYSNLVTKTSSQISNLRSTLLSSEADGDTEDDTHVCRVLRNYYTEKGRPFPNWLPPDPKAPPPQMTQAVYAQSQVGSRYGGLGGPQQPGAGGLSSLWDNGPAQPPQPQIPQSLRAGRPATTQPGPSSRDELLGRGGQAPRAGSYSGPGPAPAGSAQDRLKQRLWGTRTTSPSSSNGNGPFQPPPGGGSAGHQSQGSYEDRFAPGGSYDNSRGGGGGGGQPFVGANAPWSSDGGPYSAGGGGGGGGAANGVRRKGLPSGPRGYR
ncbi:Sec1-binding region of Mso1 domain-containing protein [Trichoderma pleuroticola]